MKLDIYDSVLQEASYILDKQATVRRAASDLCVSKSKIHRDMIDVLPRINPQLASEVKKQFEYHKSIRHIRGGEATKLKYLKK